MTSFLVTGAAGFIGYHLSRRLLAAGHDVTGFDGMTDYYDVGLKRARLALLTDAPRFSFIEAMLEHDGAVAYAMERSKPDIVVHLAAQAGVRYSIEKPRAYIDSNLLGSWQVLEAARARPPAHLLLASTSSIYGANEIVPFAEHHRAVEPLSLYAATKVGMETMAHSYAHLFGIPTTVFRFFTVFGPWGRPDMALFKFVDAILDGRPIDVYGHGRMARDFTYIDDLIEAIVRLADVIPAEANRIAGPQAVDTLSREGPYRTVNIARGNPIELMEFIRIIERCLGQTATLNLTEMQPGDVSRTFADPSLLSALTGYVPGTPVADGVAAFVDWYRDWAATEFPSPPERQPQYIARPQLYAGTRPVPPPI